MPVNERDVWAALSTVQEPELHRDLVTLNMVRDLQISAEGVVTLTVVLTTPACPLKGLIRAEVERAVGKVEGVTSVMVQMTANVTSRRSHPTDITRSIKNVIGISSGKGGVGKSTVSINVACALAQSGAKVGLLDADIYGPNQPMMAGLLSAQPRIEEQELPDGNKRQIIIPVEQYGVQFMSMGFIVPEDQAVVWRGPMLNAALRQFLGDVRWGELDYLIVDLPPGTGDVQLSLSQLARVTGIVHVTTPQDVALQDVRKGIAMFSSNGIRIPHLGIIENMSWFECPGCGTRSEIFGHGGGERTANQLGIRFLGKIPLLQNVREAGDGGVPSVVKDPDSMVATLFRSAAESLAAQVSVVNFRAASETV